MRRYAALLGMLLLLLASRTFAQNPAVLVSGQNKLAFIDGNGNGPDMDDCFFMATAADNGNFEVTAHQDENVPLRACSGGYKGNVDPGFPTDTSVFGTFMSSTVTPSLNFPNLPFSFDGIFAPMGGGGGAGGIEAMLPRTVTRVELTNGMEEVVGSGTLCKSVAKVTLENGMPLAVGLLMDTPGFLHVQNLPFEKADLSGFVMKDVFVPTTDGMVTFSLETKPNDILVQILLAGTCGRAAPTLSEWNLIGLGLALLAGGAWVLGRRERFGEALPLP